MPQISDSAKRASSLESRRVETTPDDTMEDLLEPLVFCSEKKGREISRSTWARLAYDEGLL